MQDHSCSGSINSANSSLSRSGSAPLSHSSGDARRGKPTPSAGTPTSGFASPGCTYSNTKSSVLGSNSTNAEPTSKRTKLGFTETILPIASNDHLNILPRRRISVSSEDHFSKSNTASSRSIIGYSPELDKLERKMDRRLARKDRATIDRARRQVQLSVSYGHAKEAANDGGADHAGR